MIRILELESSNGWGGQERRTVRLVNQLDKDRFDVHFAVSPYSELFKRKDRIQATFSPLSIRKSYDLAALRQIVAYIRRHHIDIVATHSGKDGWIGALAGLVTGAKVVRTRHLQTPISSPLSYNLSDRVVAVSDLVRKDLARRGVRENKLLTIHTGIDTQRFHPEPQEDIRTHLGLPSHTIVIGIVAVLRNAKRHLDLLEAFAGLHSDHPLALVIVGSGPQEGKIATYIKEHHINNAYILGHREDVPRWLASLDIFVLPSQMEALGTAILEASACGVPCIASNVGGIPETMIDGETGLLFTPTDVRDLRRKIQYLLDEPSHRKVMGEKARQFIQTHYSVASMTRQTESLYESLV